MTDTLITEGQNTTAADPQQTADAPTEGQQVAEVDAAGEQQQQAGEKGTESDKGKPEGAPEKYEFQAGEGRQFDDEVIGAFSEVAKELNLSNEAAQKVLDKVAPVLASRQEAQVAEARAQWAAESKADKEFGGDKLQENLAVAKKARDAFATPALVELLDQSGLGDHPEVIRFFVKAGKAISEDNFVGGGQGSTQPATAQKLYSASNMNP
ncbi:MAG: hypothetical protein WA049_06340 [Ferribacterium limneticum]